VPTADERPAPHTPPDRDTEIARLRASVEHWQRVAHAEHMRAELLAEAAQTAWRRCAWGAGRKPEQP
jgi:hypothetical protein